MKKIFFFYILTSITTVLFLLFPKNVKAQECIVEVGDVISGEPLNVTITNISDHDLKIGYCYKAAFMSQTFWCSTKYQHSRSWDFEIPTSQSISFTISRGIYLEPTEIDTEEEGSFVQGIFEVHQAPRPLFGTGKVLCGTTFSIGKDKAALEQAIQERKKYALPGATRPETCGEDRNGDGKKDDIMTALGCIPTDPKDLIAKLLTWGISLAGGIAFLFMIWAGFQFITSTGNPEKLQEAQSILTSAIAGLLLIIFSVFLLRLIGIKILGIPGFK